MQPIGTVRKGLRQPRQYPTPGANASAEDWRLYRAHIRMHDPEKYHLMKMKNAMRMRLRRAQMKRQRLQEGLPR